MKLTVAAGILATVLIAACGQTSSRVFYPGTEATWSWSGSTWVKLSANTAGLNLRYWKNFGGLVAMSSGNPPTWGALKWTGATWVADGAFPSRPPLPHPTPEWMILDEATNQMLYRDNDARTIWALADGAWTEVVSPDEWPQVSQMSEFVYDPYRLELVSLAWKEPEEKNADMWAWDGRVLKRLSTVTAPLSAWDFRDLVPDDSGHMLALGLRYGFSWDGKAWNRLASGFCPASSVDLGQVEMAYDAAHKQLILIGTGPDGMARTWRWTQEGWISLSTASAPSGGDSSLVYDPELPGIILTTIPIGDCCWFNCF